MNNLVSRLSFGAAMLLMHLSLACVPAHAQNPADSLAGGDPASVATTAAMPFTVPIPPIGASLGAKTSHAPFASPSFTIAGAGDLSAYAPLDANLSDAVPAWPAASARRPDPEPQPKNLYYNENPNKWQLSLAFALVRFRSSVYYASAPGLNSSLAYWWKEWIAIEGSVTSAFAPPVFENEHFRYLGYGAGPKFSLGHGRLEPWAHALVGGVHLIPQTAASGKNGLEVTMGGGVDYVINDVISAKGGVDYLGTHMFGEWQNSVQIVAGLSLRF